jgi:hypothetical protein
MGWETNVNLVQKLYIAFYGRPADPGGLRYWASQLPDNSKPDSQAVKDLISAFVNSPEAQDRFGSPSLDSTIARIYSYAFHRDATDADKAKYAGKTVVDVLVDVLSVSYGPDYGTLNEKLQYAKWFTHYIDPNDNGIPDDAPGGKFYATFSGNTDAENAKSKLFDIYLDPNHLATESKALDGVKAIANPGDYIITNPPVTGQTFTLTTGVDNIVGTSGDDVIIADNTGSSPQLTAADQINGGGGTDTLKIYMSSSSGLETIAFGQLTSVEKLYINNGTLTNNQNLDISALTGVTSITLDSPRAMVDGNAFTLTTASGQSVTLIKVLGTSGGSSSTFKLDGASDVTLNGVGTDLTLDLISAGTSLNLTTTGAASDITLNNLGNKLNTLTVLGDKDLKVTESLGNLTKIDASALTGKLTVDMSNLSSDNNITIIGGSGDDKLVFNTGHLTKNDSIDLGAGTGDLVVIKDTTLDYAGINALKGVEILGLGTSNATVDIAQITNGINQFRVEAGNLTEIFNNALSSSVFTIDNTSGNTGTVTIANKVGETATTVIIDNQETSSQTLGGLTLSGATVISLTSSGKAGNTITNFSNADNSNITVKGNADLTFTLASATTTGSKVDASAFTGKLNVTGSGKADILIGGSGDDTFIIGPSSTGTTQLTGNGGKDIFKVGNAFNSTNTIDVIITDAQKGDIIVLFDRGTESWIKTAVDVSSATSLTAALDLACIGNGSTNGIIKWFRYDGNTYIVEDRSSDATFNSASDLVIKLTGLVDLSGITSLGSFGSDPALTLV